MTSQMASAVLFDRRGYDLGPRRIVPLPRLQTLSEVVSFLENDIKDEAELIDVSVVIHALEAVEGLLRDIFDTQDRLTVVEQELVDKICDLLW
eukprot:CAMPEP_0184648874 /NCGR_PEP_ID=MMETSP0308-20130426/6118_1 /TAXON_ID=38269 /ORGANISM="Gloeochaete witrockiana, Strain SAG 46.84" /LENGTH=92 /DNA_ID=CAMNT_0027081137 /DNA_START=246 /DNA_END=521 /DNA_ORIENTATION=+